MRALLVASLLLLTGCVTTNHELRTIPAEEIPPEIPAPASFVPVPVAVPWTGDPSEAYNIVMRGLLKRGFTITFAEPNARVVRAELVRVDEYMTNRLRRRLIEGWNKEGDWYRAGMKKAGGVNATVSRRLTISAAVDPASVILTLQVESRTDAPNDSWTLDQRASEYEGAIASGLIFDLRPDGKVVPPEPAVPDVVLAPEVRPAPARAAPGNGAGTAGEAGASSVQTQATPAARSHVGSVFIDPLAGLILFGPSGGFEVGSGHLGAAAYGRLLSAGSLFKTLFSPPEGEELTYSYGVGIKGRYYFDDGLAGPHLGVQLEYVRSRFENPDWKIATGASHLVPQAEAGYRFTFGSWFLGGAVSLGYAAQFGDFVEDLTGDDRPLHVTVEDQSGPYGGATVDTGLFF